MIKTIIGKGYSDIFGLCSVNEMTQYPSAVHAMGIHAFFTILTFPAGADAGNQHPVALFKAAYRISDFFYNPYSFMSEYPSLSYFRHISFQDMQIGAANGCFHHLYKSVCRCLQNGPGYFIPGFFARAVIYECFHAVKVAQASSGNRKMGQLLL